jgi:hypothetical protein
MNPFLFIQTLIAYAWPLWFSNTSLNLLFLIREYDYQLDGKKLFFDGKPLLGPPVTLGGLLVSLILAFGSYALFPEHTLIFWKFISGFVGHTIASFIKRRFNIQSGEYVPFFTHGDYIIAFGIISAIASALEFRLLFVVYLITVICTPCVTYCAYKIGLRQHPF